MGRGRLPAVCVWLYIKLKKWKKDWETEYNTSFFIAKTFQKSSALLICESSILAIEENFFLRKISEVLICENFFSQNKEKNLENFSSREFL